MNETVTAPATGAQEKGKVEPLTISQALNLISKKTKNVSRYKRIMMQFNDNPETPYDLTDIETQLASEQVDLATLNLLVDEACAPIKELIFSAEQLEDSLKHWERMLTNVIDLGHNDVVFKQESIEASIEALEDKIMEINNKIEFFKVNTKLK